jgi:hypothetical protein
MKKGHIKVGDLQPKKDVKGCGGNSKFISSGAGSTGNHSNH